MLITSPLGLDRKNIVVRTMSESILESPCQVYAPARLLYYNSMSVPLNVLCPEHWHDRLRVWTDRESFFSKVREWLCDLKASQRPNWLPPSWSICATEPPSSPPGNDSGHNHIVSVLMMCVSAADPSERLSVPPEPHMAVNEVTK